MSGVKHSCKTEKAQKNVWLWCEKHGSIRWTRAGSGRATFKGSGCGVVIKLVNRGGRLTLGMIALQLDTCSAMHGEIKGLELLLGTLNEIYVHCLLTRRLRADRRNWVACFVFFWSVIAVHGGGRDFWERAAAWISTDLDAMRRARTSVPTVNGSMERLSALAVIWEEGVGPNRTKFCICTAEEFAYAVGGS